VEEQEFPVPLGLLTDDADFIARRIDPLPAGFLDQSTMTFQFFNQSWLVRVDGLTVLVDPCNGNGRRRTVPYFDNRSLPWLERLAAAGAAPETVDVVFCTHLHSDHCGWNTTWSADRWVPTFPRARYVFTETEYRRWDTGAEHQHPNLYNESVFDECVRPVVEAGQAVLVSPPYQVSASVTVEAAPGHTEGHAMLRLESQGQRAYFTGDAFHHPAQITRPELRLPGCDQPAMAVSARRALVARLHSEQALLFPAHFAAPHYGTVGKDGNEHVFVPAELRLRRLTRSAISRPLNAERTEDERISHTFSSERPGQPKTQARRHVRRVCRDLPCRWRSRCERCRAGRNGRTRIRAFMAQSPTKSRPACQRAARAADTGAEAPVG
jgi:glyoxylase-like metal-dependent hydrolase (beta-lactamase superfamily II)